VKSGIKKPPGLLFWKAEKGARANVGAFQEKFRPGGFYVALRMKLFRPLIYFWGYAPIS
jgi:hypothetical protein